MIFNPDLLTGPHADRVADLIRFDPLFQKLPTQLFTFDNGKTPKGEKRGYLTAIMYLAPARLSGYQMCPFAHLAQCEEPCLNTAGRGKFDNVQKARIRKTLMYHQFPNEFNALLVSEMHRAQRKADRMGLTLVVRLNGTSDIAWENHTIIESWHTFPNRDLKWKTDVYNGDDSLESITINRTTRKRSIPYDDPKQGKIKLPAPWTIFDLFPTVQFYDYTKAPTRHKLPANYHLTFSYSGVDSYVPIVQKWRTKNKTQSLAVVFDKIPAGVINGDDSDLRFLDPINTVIGLTAKGNAKNDATGFVLRPGV